jgi:uncharacterized protein YbjT (DUF2867 family)
VRILSRNPAAAQVQRGISHHPADLRNGEGLAEGLTDVEVVVDASNAPREARQVLVEGTRRLLDAEIRAGVGHHVGISIVGCDRVPTAYYRAKVAQEKAITTGEAPWSLLRATQFHQLLAGAFATAARFRVSPTGAARLQPIDPDVVAKRVAEAVHAGPRDRLADVAGPKMLSLTELAGSWQRQHDRRLLPVRLPMLGRLGRSLRDGGLCNPDAAAPGLTFEHWLADE